MMGVDGFLPKDYLPAASKFVESSLVWEILSIAEGRSLADNLRFVKNFPASTSATS